MLLIDATNAEAYLRDSGRIASHERVDVRELSGGVSNIVLMVEFPDHAREPFVLKQAREQLRVAQPWFCSPERIWREVEVLQACGGILKESTADGLPLQVPRVLWSDRNSFCFAMTAAPTSARPWKEMLLAGDPAQGERSRPTRAYRQWLEKIGAACGKMLAELHCDSAAALGEACRDTRFFEHLRVDPYYRQIAQVHPRLSDRIDQLISSMEQRQLALVHGDFSPKNLLVSDEQLLLIDCEVGHLGDPAFDLGFFLSHLLLKAAHFPDRAEALVASAMAFMRSYEHQMRAAGKQEQTLWSDVQGHLQACMLARLDGKSPVEYLNERECTAIRREVLAWFDAAPKHYTIAFANILSLAKELSAP